VGRSTIVGKPMAAILMQKWSGSNATVTVVHSRSENISELCRSADILISAIGKPNTITADMVRDGAVVIDVGINRISDPSRKSGYRIVGDVDFDAVKDKCQAITPVPGGVGPLTIVMLLQNTITAYKKKAKLLKHHA
jgi:methylenetetrahydrofolate dehydrogenase (NADP+)/methenyltetrahydrofolate cyclohydrolase